MISIHRPLAPALLLAAAALAAGCASKGFVREQVSSLESRMQPTAEEARSASALAQQADGRARALEQETLRLQQETQLARDLALGNIRHEEVRRSTVEFGFDSAAVPEEAQPALDDLARELESHANYMALVTGYTDATGDEEYNFGLAERRAAAVRRYMAERLGPGFVRLAVIGFGESMPVAENDTPEGRARNRRTDVVLVRPIPANEGEVPTAARP